MAKGDSNDKKKSSQDGAQLLVVNLRGIVNTRTPVRTTLEQLGIIKRFSAAIIPDSPQVRGMLNLSKNNVAWCKLDTSMLETLQKSGKMISGATQKSGVSNASKAENSERKESMVFRLNSPRGGFKRSIRRQFGQGGTLGPNPKLPELVNTMTN
jgi:large subunit ribosomal protein L30